MFRKPNNRAGISLVELAVTLLVIGIAAGVAVPKISTAVMSTRLDTGVAQMRADIKAARQHAISSGTTQQIQVLTGTNEYKLINMPDINHPGTTGYVVDFDELQGSLTITNVNYEGTDNVTFDIYGKPNRGGSVTLQSGSFTKTITIDATTGKTTVN